jgi:hypothetical protein
VALDWAVVVVAPLVEVVRWAHGIGETCGGGLGAYACRGWLSLCRVKGRGNHTSCAQLEARGMAG